MSGLSDGSLNLPSLIFLKPNLETLGFFDLLWIVGIADFVLKYITIALKCLVVALPKVILAVKSKVGPGCGHRPHWSRQGSWAPFRGGKNGQGQSQGQLVTYAEPELAALSLARVIPGCLLALSLSTLPTLLCLKLF